MRAMPSSSWTPRSSSRALRWLKWLIEADGVFAFDAVPRMEHALRPVAVVGQQQQALRVAVEAADGIEAFGALPKSRSGPARRPSARRGDR